MSYLPSKYRIKQFLDKYNDKKLYVPCRDNQSVECIDCDIDVDECFKDITEDTTSNPHPEYRNTLDWMKEHRQI